MNKLTNQEAAEELRKRLCCEQPVAHFCNDICLYGKNLCPIQMAMDMLEKEENNE